MAELWIPEHGNTPDVTNLFDMMVFLQAEMNGIAPEDQEDFAVFGLKSLAACLHAMHPDERELTLVTDMAIIDSTEDKGHGAIVQRIGLQGTLDDVHCMRINPSLPTLNYTLGLDVVSVFPPDDPEDSDLLLGTGKAPIAKVNYIETAA